LIVVFYQWVSPRIAIPSTVHGLVGTALGLLLVFRTNASYDRFWEGRRMWGSIINESRNLGRNVCVHLAGDPARRDAVVRWTIAFAYASMNSLRGKAGLGPIADRLPPEAVRTALAETNVPLHVAVRIAEQLAAAKAEGRISDILLVNLDQNVQLLIDYLGACERIHKTPLPFAYVVHLRRALMLFNFTLPFALVKDFGMGTVPMTLLAAYIFFGIEEIGVEIEDPFGHDDNDLPLDQICATIERDLRALIDPEGGGPAEAIGSGPPRG
jgi:putative membrane protein